MRIEFFISLYNTLRFVQGGMIYDDETQYYEKVCSFVTLFEANFLCFGLGKGNDSRLNT